MAAHWYIVNTHSGYEKKAAAALKEQASQKGMGSLIMDVTVPTENVVEVRRGKKTSRERNFFPGYMLVKMEMNDETWHLVKDIPKVTGFLGGGGKPQPIPEREVQAIFEQVQENIDRPKHQVTFDIGENVKVIDGPFYSFIGEIEEIDEDKERLKVAVSIFGRPTPVELEYGQVEKV